MPRQLAGYGQTPAPAVIGFQASVIDKKLQFFNGHPQNISYS